VPAIISCIKYTIAGITYPGITAPILANIFIYSKLSTYVFNSIPPENIDIAKMKAKGRKMLCELNYRRQHRLKISRRTDLKEVLKSRRQGSILIKCKRRNSNRFCLKWKYADE
jgi:hypothetical protein